MIRLIKMPCPLCGEADNKEYIAFPDSPFKVVTCKKCGMMRLNPRIAEANLNKIYHSIFCGDINKPLDESPSSFFQRLIQWKRQHLINHIHNHRLAILKTATSNHKLLEIGCGDGGFLAYLKKRKWQVSGTEYTPHAAALGRRRGITVMEGELGDLKLPAEHYDLIVMYHVLEHVYHPKQLLQEIHRILKPTGNLVIEVPNISSISARIFGSKWYLLVAPQHVNHFSPSTLTQILERSKLVVSRAFHSSPDSFISWKLGLKAIGRKLLGLKKKTTCPSLTRLDEIQDKPTLMLPLRTQIVDLLLDPFLFPLVLLEKLLRNGTIITVVARKQDR